MKKTILISIVASSMLFATNVDNLTVDQTSSVTGSTTTGATVNQAQTNIDTLGGATSDVDNIAIKQTNAIRNGSTIGGTVEGSVTVNQGETTIDNSTISDLGLDSDNVIDGSTIDGLLSQVDQGSFITTESNGTDSTAGDVDIDADNTISGSGIHNSTVKQSYTSLENGAQVSGLDLRQVNTINNESDITNSTVKQATTTVNGSSLDGLTSTWGSTTNTNTMSGVTATNISNLVQNDIEVRNGSDVTNIRNGSKNNLTGSTADNSDIIQNSILVDNSKVTNLRQYRENDITNIIATDSNLTQNIVSITNNSDVTDLSSSTISRNVMNNFTTTNSILSQNDVEIDDSTVNHLHAIQNNIIDGTNSNSALIAQGKTIITN